MTLDLISYHILSARNTETTDYNHSNLHYKIALKIMSKQLIRHETNEKKTEFNALLSEYFNFKVIHLLNRDPFFARKLSILSLEFVQKAKEFCTDSKRKEELERGESQILRKIIYTFGCILPKANFYYTIKCPIFIKQHLPTDKTSITIQYKNPLCSICKKSFLLCNHRVNYKYEGKTATINALEGEIIDISMVTDPKIPHSIIDTLYLSQDLLESRLDENKLYNIKLNSNLYCNECKMKKLKTDEITYHLFKNMQIPDIDFNQSKKVKRNDMQFRSYLIDSKSNINPQTTIGKPLYIYQYKEKFIHIPSEYLTTDPTTDE
jgi:hypothetical protein